MTHSTPTFTSATPTIAEQLRDELTAIERQIVIMQETPTGVRDVIQRMDHIDTLLYELRATRYDARAEQSRAESLRARLFTRDAAKAARLVQKNGLAAQLADSPTWQTIAEADATTRARSNRRMLIVGSVVLVVGLLLFVVVPWLFPAPPQANLNQVQQLIAENKPDDALTSAQAEYARVPSDPSSLLWVGALQQQRGDSTAAQATETQARKQYNDDAQFFSDRSMVRLQLRDFAGSEADARQLMTDQRTAPQGQFMLGNIYEAQGNRQNAIAAYEQAAQLADAQNNAQITVAAKSQIAMLLQSPPPNPTAPNPTQQP